MTLTDLQNEILSHIINFTLDDTTKKYNIQEVNHFFHDTTLVLIDKRVKECYLLDDDKKFTIFESWTLNFLYYRRFVTLYKNFLILVVWSTRKKKYNLTRYVMNKHRHHRRIARRVVVNAVINEDIDTFREFVTSIDEESNILREIGNLRDPSLIDQYMKCICSSLENIPLYRSNRRYNYYINIWKLELIKKNLVSSDSIESLFNELIHFPSNTETIFEFIKKHVHTIADIRKYFGDMRTFQEIGSIAERINSLELSNYIKSYNS